MTSPICVIPDLPPARGFEGSATGELRPRYEDIDQAGRVQLTSLIPGLSAVWRTLYDVGERRRMREQGILPILSRLVITGEEGPFSFGAAIHVSGTWRLARETGGERIFLDMWLEAHAPIGFTLGAPPASDAPRVLVGRVYAGHVITRPFAPPAARKVTRLDIPGLPGIPEDEHPFEGAADLIAGHTVELVHEHAFGMMHTDANQHVNSLVYPRLFEEAVVRHLGDRGDPRPLLARAVEIRYRKPFFLGDRAKIVLGVDPSGPLAVGAFLPAHADAAPPSCAIAMRLG